MRVLSMIGCHRASYPWNPAPTSAAHAPLPDHRHQRHAALHDMPTIANCPALRRMRRKSDRRQHAARPLSDWLDIENAANAETDHSGRSPLHTFGHESLQTWLFNRQAHARHRPPPARPSRTTMMPDLLGADRAACGLARL